MELTASGDAAAGVFALDQEAEQRRFRLAEERRTRLLEITGECIFGMMLAMDGKTLLSQEGLPSDCIVLAYHYGVHRLSFVVGHESFDPNPADTAEPPALDVRITSQPGRPESWMDRPSML